MLTGNFVFISVEERESGGKIYKNVNLEMDDGQMLRIGVDDGVVEQMKKYQSYTGFFKVGMFGRDVYIRLAGVQASAK